ncbi:hypothetical protein CROQUDRAFT_650179 [Cronartium quercuum f. sp. fusiforme G11]|uniref:SigF-like NTF2-like domain-containing protein n=1 Tax=Cronartium quercuum f. sp. fusiforme G11 TaxID=708437 RepID=A0A9P6NV11_9BASI|nr:hypothetical protein CROQUDRAFT_650179 [Cronartium quercuum f. sp. fusiforme G11]
MENPVKEIRDVVRSITEPYEASVIAKNVEKYFTPDAYILHPILKQPQTAQSRDDLVGIYKMLRVMTINNKIEFHSVMFNEDMTRGALDLTEYLNVRWNPLLSSNVLPARLLVFIDLRKCKDGLYRISRQHDNMPSDFTLSGQAAMIPGLAIVNDIVKGSIGFIAAKLGRFLLARGWLGV